ncbi:MAG: glycosyltransferase family 2 protein [Acidimicrobiia bacterium]
MPSTPVNPAVDSITAFFPCLDDEATIASMVNAAVKTIDEVGADGEVIVVNDGSTDRSQEVLEELSDSQPWLRIVVHEHSRGYGGALLSGFAGATKQWVFYTDGDGQFDPTELALLVDHARDDVDVVQGVRRRRADSPVRRLGGRVYHRLTVALFGLKIRGADSDFRLIRRSLLDRIQLSQRSGVIGIEMVRKFQDAGARFVRVPVNHYPRRHGRSHRVRVAEGPRTFWNLVRLWFRLIVLREGRRSARTAGPATP